MAEAEDIGHEGEQEYNLLFEDSEDSTDEDNGNVSTDNWIVIPDGAEGLAIAIDDMTGDRVTEACREILALQHNVDLCIKANAEYPDVVDHCILNSAWFLTFKNRILYNLNAHGYPPMTPHEAIGLLEFIGLCSLYRTSPQFMCENTGYFRTPMLSQARFFQIVRSFNAPNTPGSTNWESTGRNAKQYHTALKEFSALASSLAWTTHTSMIIDDDKMPYRSVSMGQAMGLQRTYHRDAAPGPVVHMGASVNSGLLLSAVPQIDNISNNIFHTVVRRATGGM